LENDKEAEKKLKQLNGKAMPKDKASISRHKIVEQSKMKRREGQSNG